MKKILSIKNNYNQKYLKKLKTKQKIQKNQQIKNKQIKILFKMNCSLKKIQII